MPPVVVLTKADVLADAGAARARASTRCADRCRPRIDVFAVDATAPMPAPRSAGRLARPRARPLVLLGSSGAGKSTLTNTLLGDALQDTGAVREHDGRGKHTTTSRSLHRLPGGACVIDTPGLRALRPDVDEATLAGELRRRRARSPCAAAFATAGTRASRAARCATGSTRDRLRNYHKLLREARRDSLNALERREQRRDWKMRGREGAIRARAKRG